MSAKKKPAAKTTRTPIVLDRPRDNERAEDFADRFADEVADVVVAEVNRLRAAKGKPPLK